MPLLLSPHYAGPWPSDLGSGIWGSRAPYTCTSRFCRRGMWVEPRTRIISHPTSDEPGETAWECPYCGRAVVEESDMDAPRRFTVTNRYSIRATQHLLAA